MRDCMMYYISVSNQDLEKAVEILADVVQHANFTGVQHMALH
jgi:predicted Zn-dependent peptidase